MNQSLRTTKVHLVCILTCKRYGPHGKFEHLDRNANCACGQVKLFMGWVVLGGGLFIDNLNNVHGSL